MNTDQVLHYCLMQYDVGQRNQQRFVEFKPYLNEKFKQKFRIILTEIFSSNIIRGKCT